jgi:hypothetical protein
VADIEELTGGEADHETSGCGGGDPALDMALRRRPRPGETRERDDACRPFQCFQAAHHLGLLNGEPFRRKHLVGFREGIVVKAVKPGSEVGVARPALGTAAQMRVAYGLSAGSRRAPKVRELVVTQMTARRASTKK